MSVSDLRRAAREKLRGNWLKMALIMFIAGQLNSKLGLENVGYPTRTLILNTPFGFLGENGALSFGIPVGYAWIIRIIIFLLAVFGMVATSGVMKSALRVLRGEKPSASDLLLRGVCWKMLWMNIVRFVINGAFLLDLPVDNMVMVIVLLPVFVWSFIAGIIYSMADYLLINNPAMGAVEALRESRRRMKGHKGKYFGLSMSFTGWVLLAAFASGLMNRFLPIPGIVSAWIRSAFMAVLGAYIYTARAAFCMHISGESI